VGGSWGVCLLAQLVSIGAPDTNELSFGGEFGLAYVWRDRALERAAFALNNGGDPFAGPAPDDSTEFFFGRLTLRLDGRLADAVDLRLELEAPSRARRATVPFGANAFQELNVEQAYVQIHPDDSWMVRVGIQDLRLQNRPPGIGEPFFLDLGEAESFFAGFAFPPPATATPPALSTAVRPTVERFGSRPAGLRVRFDPSPLWMAEAFVLNVGEDRGGISIHRSEVLLGLHASASTLEEASCFLLAAFCGGPFHGARVWTVGGGVDAYLDDPRTLEVFAEGYAQFGSLIDEAGIDVDKRGAWAAQVGLRKYFGRFWIEAAAETRTGDEDPADGHDNAFQSYENADQFLVVEDDELGLDVDTNVRALKLSAGWGLGRGRDAPGEWSARLDAGWFELDEPIAGVFGTRLTGRRQLGLELDGTLAWQVQEQLEARLRIGWLGASDVLEALGADRDTLIVSAGFLFRF
jgi:hypothetical protein